MIDHPLNMIHRKVAKCAEGFSSLFSGERPENNKYHAYSRKRHLGLVIKISNVI